MIAAVIVGKSYANTISMVYEAGRAGAVVFTIRTDTRHGGWIERYRRMNLEGGSKYCECCYYLTEGSMLEKRRRIKELVLRIYTSGRFSHVTLIAVDDEYSLMLNEMICELPENISTFGFGKDGREAFSWLADKGLQKICAKRAFINVAEGSEVKIDSIHSFAYNGKYPCIVKVAKSMECYTRMKGIVGVCMDEQMLNRVILDARQYGLSSVIVEQYLAADCQYGLAGACVNGMVVGVGCFEKDRVGSGERIGVTVTGKVIDYSKDSQLLDFVTRVVSLMRQLKYNGLFDIDIIRAENTYYLVEINLRAGAFAFCVANAGLNLMTLYFRGLLRNSAFDVATPMTFNEWALNERALLEEYDAGAISIFTFFSALRKSKSRKIRNRDDPRPYSIFCKGMTLMFIRKFLYPIVLLRRFVKKRGDEISNVNFKH